MIIIKDKRCPHTIEGTVCGTQQILTSESKATNKRGKDISQKYDSFFH